MENMFEEFKNKTRVLVLSTQPCVAKLLLEVLNFHSKDFDFYVENDLDNKNNSDFIILETCNLQSAALFKPNIALLTSEMVGEEILSVLENMIAGGVLVYPISSDEIVAQSVNFFRKLAFTETEFHKTNETFILETNIGQIPVCSQDEFLIKNIDGVKLLTQQFGVMEEDFYEPVMSFE